MITQTLQLNLVPKGVWPRLYVSQYDAGSRTLTFEIYNGDQRFTLTSGTTAKIQGTKPDRHGFSYDADVDTSNNVITADITQQMTAAHGEAYCELVLFKSGQRIGTLNFVMMIQQAGLNDETDTSDSDLPDIIAEATEQMLTAEAYAKGTRNGTAVTSGQTGYHDNSKYYKEQAATQASNASTSATSANTNALKAEGYAVGKQNGTTQTSGTYYHNNAQYYKEQAASSATTASTKAGEASTSANTASQKASAASTSAQTASDKALVAEGYAKGTQNGTPVGSTSPYYHNNAEYFKDLANPTVAANVSFNNSGTEMSSTNVQDGIVENRTSIQNLSTVFSKNGAKNFMPYPYTYTTRTSNGVTFTDNHDGSITLNGTNTGNNTTFMYHLRSDNTTIELLSKLKKMNTSFKLIGGVTEPYTSVVIDFYDSSNTYISTISSNRSGMPTEFTIPSNAEKMDVFTRCSSNAVYSNLTIYPMLYLASITDNTYQPYAKTNQQLTQETTGLIDNDKVNGCVNLLKNNFTSNTSNGVSAVTNSDGTITLTVTASHTSDRMYYINQSDGWYALGGSASWKAQGSEVEAISPNGKYKLTGKPNDSVTRIGVNSTGAYIYINGSVSSGTYVFKPMISLASMNLSYNDYVPYAMTNRELTQAITYSRGYLPIVDLGTSYTQELKDDISSGAFKKAVVGGKLTINGHVYYLAHPDYWLNTGDTQCTKHHMVVVPASNLVDGKMNNDNDTTGGYIGSGLKSGTNHDNSANTALADIAAIIKADFGAANILTHREYFTNAVTNGRPSAGAWYDSDIDLMNENMVYGGDVFSPHSDGSSVPEKYTIDKSQLKLFAERPDRITNRAYWWLRDVVSATSFADVNGSGNANYDSASYSRGVRPAFAIC